MSEHDPRAAKLSQCKADLNAALANVFSITRDEGIPDRITEMREVKLREANEVYSYRYRILVKDLREGDEVDLLIECLLPPSAGSNIYKLARWDLKYKPGKRPSPWSIASTAALHDLLSATRKAREVLDVLSPAASYDCDLAVRGIMEKCVLHCYPGQTLKR